ncbi:DUF5617 domain-containing protein [Legionella hackeliae]|uniref:RavJ-like C-terminal domain-containing protein n=1 Tax=Legionella hackeliae TaxID=449 RepID=A0A0A8UMP8_LEGHA|nr:DUF5617 domain-containing protein [Legionella hackeliae]KTD10520.1 hypothetical protein Lhac_2888 [Legionella hackeliae]CEK10023.1 protein of unknown function [Legionella hackeliae]STX46747.1 Uncharacterised protein [Legionella hackeliae]
MSFEQLLELIQWFSAISNSKFPLSTNIPVSTKDWELLKKTAQEHLNLLQQAETQSSDTEKNINAIERAMSFIAFCSNQDDELTNISQASLLWLTNQYKIFKEDAKRLFVCRLKLGSVFTNYLDNHSDAIAFYEQHEELQHAYPAGAQFIKEKKEQGAVETKTFDELIKDIHFQLKEVNQPFTVIPLLDEYFDEPTRLAAFIVWLCQQEEVSENQEGSVEERILNSGLLQAIFRFHIQNLSQEDNPLSRLYKLLSENNATKELAYLATKHTVEESAWRSYNLAGQLCLHATLNVAEENKIEFSGVSSQTAFNNLCSLFKDTFFYHAFNWLYHDQKKEENFSLWRKALNENGVAFNALPDLINQLITNYEEKPLYLRLELLAKLVSKDTLTYHLITQQQVNIIYLLFYHKSTIYDFFKGEELIGYLNNFLADTKVGAEKKFDLIYLLHKWLRRNGSTHLAHLIYQMLVNFLLQPPYVLLDDSRVEMMRDEYQKLIFSDQYYSEEDSSSDDELVPEPSSDEEDSEESVSEDGYVSEEENAASDEEIEHTNLQYVMAKFLKKLDDYCDDEWVAFCDLRLGKDTFDNKDYEALFERWSIYMRKSHFFRRTRYPDKEIPTFRETKFKETLIKYRFSLLQDKFVLEDMLAVLFNLSEEKEIFSCQQALVNVLIESDGALGKQIIKLLTQYNRYWFFIVWDEERPFLLKEAVRNRNLVLTTYLLTQRCKLFDSVQISKGFIKAIKLSDLTFVKLFLIPEVIQVLTGEQIESIYRAALDANNREIFKFLLDNRQLLSLPKTLYLTLLDSAVLSNSTEELVLLCKLDYELSGDELQSLFLNALSHEHWHGVISILDKKAKGHFKPETFHVAWDYVSENWPLTHQRQFIRTCGTRFSADLIERATYYYFGEGKVEGVSDLIKLRGENELSKAKLEKIFQYSLENAEKWFEVAYQITLEQSERALTQKDVSTAILDIVIPTEDSKLLNKIYERFDSSLHPDKNTVQQAFRHAFNGFDFSTILILVDKALGYLDAKLLLIHLGRAYQDGWKPMIRTLESACKAKNISSKDVSTLIKKLPEKDARNLCSLQGDFEPDIEVLYEAVRKGNYSLVSVFFQENNTLKKNPDLIRGIFTEAKKQPHLLPLFCQLPHSRFLSFQEKTELLRDLVEMDEYQTIKSFWEGEISYPRTLWMAALDLAIEKQKPDLISFLDKLTSYYQIAWDTKLLEGVRLGSLDVVKTLTRILISKKIPIDINGLRNESSSKNHVQLTAWLDQMRALHAYQRVSESKETVLLEALAVLRDYTKSGSTLTRFFTGHWHRNHITEVTDILNTSIVSISDLVEKLNAVPLVNKHGSLARRITYIVDVLLPLHNAENDSDEDSSYDSSYEDTDSQTEENVFEEEVFQAPLSI